MIRWNLKKETSTYTIYNTVLSCKLIQDMKPEMHKITDKRGNEMWFGYVNGKILPAECPEFRGMAVTIALFIQEQIEIERKKATKELAVE